MRKLLRWMKGKQEILVKGGHCGICGCVMPNEIVEQNWRWSICDRCGE